MNRQQTVVAVLCLAVLGGIVALSLAGGEGPGPLGPGPAPAATGEGAEGRRAAVGEDAPRAAADGVRAEVAAAEPGRDLHPSVRAALTGFTGRIVDPLARPVADSKVRLFRFAPDVLFRPQVSMFVEGVVNEPQVVVGDARTGADGRFTIDGVFPRAVFLLHADADGDAPTWRVVQRDAPPGELADLGDIVLAPAGILTGEVRDQDGRPVPGALVRAVDLPGTVLSFVPLERFDPTGGILVSEQGGLAFPCPAWVEKRFEDLPIPSTRTDGEGRFRLTGVTPGGNLVAVTARGFLSNVRPRVVVDPGEEKDLGRLVLPEGEVAYGKVVDDEERPVAGAEVMVAAKSANIPVHFASFAPPTDAEGTFELGGFPSGDVIVAARRRRGEPWLLSEAQPVTRDLVVTLPSVRTLTLDVVDRAGERVAAPKLQLTPGAPEEGSLEQAMWGVTSPLELRSRQREDEKGRIVLRDLPRGRYTLLVASPAHAVSAQGVDLREKSEELRIELQDRIRFEVLVLDPDGAPVGGAEVFARAEGPRPRAPDAPVHAGTTGDEGKVTIDAVSAREVALTASHPAFGNADARSPVPPAGPLVLQFAKPGSIEGLVAEGGAVPTPGKWMVYLFPRGGERDAAFPNMPQLTAPDGDGRFRFAGVRPGRYRVGIQSSLDVIRSAGKVSEIAVNAFLQPELPSEGVELQAGGRAEVLLDTEARRQIDGPSGTVRGSVMVGGRLGTGYLVQAYGRGGRLVAEVDQAGLFDLGQVAVGDLQVQLIERPSGDIFSMRGGFGSALWSQQVKVEENQQVDLEIDVQLGRIEGFVFAPDGSPAANAQVTATGSDATGRGPSNLSEIADADGRFTFDKAPAGTYLLEARAKDLGRARLAGVVVDGGLAVSGVRLELFATRKVRGRIDFTAVGGERPRRLWMQLQAVEGGEGGAVAWSSADEEGRFEFEDVLPGRYRIQFFGGSPQFVHDGELAVGNSDLDGVVVRPVRREPERDR
jgi:protocatechuate 3,4-dioxygenase beta subunit